MRQLVVDHVSRDDGPVILVAVRPSARFHQLGGIGSVLLLYPAREPLAHHSNRDKAGMSRAADGNPLNAA